MGFDDAIALDAAGAGAGSDCPATTLASVRLADVMTPNPIRLPVTASIREAAQTMAASAVSCVLLMEDDRVVGIATTGDMTDRVVAGDADPSAPVSTIMTASPVTLPADALGSDVLHVMLERRIGHLPVVDGQGRPLGVVTQTDLTRRQALTAGAVIHDIVGAADSDEIAEEVRRIPALLRHLIEGGARHEVATRLITDIGDAATRRLLVLAEERLGPPPAPYLWLACGSQGRQEQTGVSDQDNCLILDDGLRPEDDAYFEELARFVSDGLAACGYFYCPGGMMATTPRWRQPLKVWRGYFEGWIEKPDPMARMLSSVMFDLRPIGGETGLFDDLHRTTLEAASENSIFVAHMIANSLSHAPPLGLFGGLATGRGDAPRGRIDLKHAGVAPIVDLGRMYALQGRIEPVNTRARLVAAGEAALVSAAGGRDLLDAYDLIAETRLQAQATAIRVGEAPGNMLDPTALSQLERAHLRDAFHVVRTMQSALGNGRSAVL
ncbi:MAG: DUF294 nucleotidyltransferase-like domain-containing protein [Pseudomonadota bacterium]